MTFNDFQMKAEWAILGEKKFGEWKVQRLYRGCVTEQNKGENGIKYQIHKKRR